jgi:ribosomal-protein-alanine acetyltransferase
MTEVWPLVARRLAGAEVTGVAGPDPHLYWPADWEPLQAPERVSLLGFVRNVEQIYAEANIVIVPTLVSAGTNLKVLEALACGRAVVSTTSGCGGLGLEHGRNAWIADTASDLADGIVRLLNDEPLRARLAAAGRLHVEQGFDWARIGQMERDMLRNLQAPSVVVRRAQRKDLDAVAEIQRASLPSASWRVEEYLNYNFTVAVAPHGVAGFVVARETAPDEIEILNLAVAPSHRRQRIGIRLMNCLLATSTSSFFLEVRESNTAARTLYEKLGFREAGRRPNYYHDPRETAIVMRRSVAGK